MIEYILQATLISLCGLALKIHLWERSLTTCIFLFSVTLYIFTKDFINDYSYIFIFISIIFTFIRAMFKPKKERIFYYVD